MFDNKTLYLFVINYKYNRNQSLLKSTYKSTFYQTLNAFKKLNIIKSSLCIQNTTLVHSNLILEHRIL